VVVRVSPALRQAVSTVELSGVVRDPTGAYIAGAAVTVTQTLTGLTRSPKTGTDGSYVIPRLPVGPYRLTAEQKVFKTVAQTGIELQAGDNPRIDASMQVGATNQRIAVNAATELVQTAQPPVSFVVEQQRIVQLPLNGRQAIQLTFLAGGATQSNSCSVVTSKNYPSSVSLSVAGGLGNSTNYLMDGTENEDAFSNVNQPFPFRDALPEFSVETGTLSARYGKRPGATVSVVTKSGTSAGRITTLGPGLVNVDVGIARHFRIRERGNLEAPPESFNVPNRANFSDPGATLTSAIFGRLTGALDPRILQFSQELHF
jgi:hypothetical protein